MLNKIIKVDLHIHSVASEYKDGNIVKQSTIDNLDILFEKLEKNDINLFAFSDHNRFDINLFYAARKIVDSKRYPKVENILPTVEFDVEIEQGKQPCHILTVFDTKNDEDLASIVNGIESDRLTDKNEYYSRQRFENLLGKIALNVLLIGCQRKDINNPNGGNNCISDSCENPLQFFKTGYINALEYQSNKVEGILLHNLSDFPKDIGISLIAGSDCHQWCAYPFHHDGQKNTKDRVSFFKIKALPSFLGLVLAFSSPQTRFKRTSKSYEYIESFTMNGNDYELSSGINAIIGENGSGKSTLLEGIAQGEQIKTAYMKRLLKKNGFSVNNKNSDKIKLVTQTQLAENNYNNEQKSVFGDEIDFGRIENSFFETTINEYANDLFDYIKKKISSVSKKDALSTVFAFDLDLENSDTYYVQITENEEFTKRDNDFTLRLDSINSIMRNIAKEYLQRIYTEEEKELLKEAFLSLTKLRTSIIPKYLSSKGELAIRNNLSSFINDYETTVKNKSTTADAQKMEYNKEKVAFINAIVSSIKEQITFEKMRIRKSPLKNGDGISIVREGGFDFVAKTKYSISTDIFDDFIKRVFITKYQDENILKKIESIDSLIEAIKGATDNNNYLAKYRENVQKFITDLEIEEFTIIEATNNTKIGNTLGEKSLAFYRFITKKGNDKVIYMIDQPEDNLSNPRIIASLISYLRELMDKTQIIFVTHNPLLVINLDVDNVVFIKNANSNFSIQSGCLEDEGILKLVAENMDGGKEALKRRLKVYGD